MQRPQSLLLELAPEMLLRSGRRTVGSGSWHQWVSGAGAVVLPVNTRFKGAEVVHVLNTAKARIVFIVDSRH